MANSNPSPATRFKPGQSGNPGGRPKGIAAVAREHTGRVIEVLVEALDDKDARVRILAAKELLDRGYGKAIQDIKSENINHNYVISDQPMTDEEWRDQYVTEH